MAVSTGKFRDRVCNHMVMDNDLVQTKLNQTLPNKTWQNSCDSTSKHLMSKPIFSQHQGSSVGLIHEEDNTICDCMCECDCEDHVSGRCPHDIRTNHVNNRSTKMDKLSAVISEKPPQTCVLCQSADRQGYNTHSLFDCCFLSESDRYDLLYGHDSEEDEEESECIYSEVVPPQKLKTNKLTGDKPQCLIAPVADLSKPNTCVLCKAAGDRHGYDTHWLLQCPFLSEEDRYDLLYGHYSDLEEDEVSVYGHDPVRDEEDEENVYETDCGHVSNRGEEDIHGYDSKCDEENVYSMPKNEKNNYTVCGGEDMHTTSCVCEQSSDTQKEDNEEEEEEVDHHSDTFVYMNNGFGSVFRNSICSYDTQHEDEPISSDCLRDNMSIMPTSCITRPVLVAYYDDMPITILLSSGSNVNTIGLNIVQSFEMPYVPICKVSYDDGIPDGAVGELHCQLLIEQTELQLDAFVVPEVEQNVLGGAPFMTTNDVFVLPSKEMIVINGSLNIQYSRNSFITTGESESSTNHTTTDYDMSGYSMTAVHDSDNYSESEKLYDVSSSTSGKTSNVSSNSPCVLYHGAVKETPILEPLFEAVTPMNDDVHPRCTCVELVHPGVDLVSGPASLQTKHLLQQSAIICDISEDISCTFMCLKPVQARSVSHSNSSVIKSELYPVSTCSTQLSYFSQKALNTKIKNNVYCATTDTLNSFQPTDCFSAHSDIFHGQAPGCTMNTPLCNNITSEEPQLQGAVTLNTKTGKNVCESELSCSVCDEVQLWKNVHDEFHLEASDDSQMWRYISDESHLWENICDESPIWKEVCDESQPWREECDESQSQREVCDESQPWREECNQSQPWREECDESQPWREKCDKTQPQREESDESHPHMNECVILQTWCSVCASAGHVDQQCQSTCGDTQSKSWKCIYDESPHPGNVTDETVGSCVSVCLKHINKLQQFKSVTGDIPVVHYLQSSQSQEMNIDSVYSSLMYGTIDDSCLESNDFVASDNSNVYSDVCNVLDNWESGIGGQPASQYHDINCEYIQQKSLTETTSSELWRSESIEQSHNVDHCKTMCTVYRGQVIDQHQGMDYNASPDYANAVQSVIETITFDQRSICDKVDSNMLVSLAGQDESETLSHVSIVGKSCVHVAPDYHKTTFTQGDYLNVLSNPSNAAQVNFGTVQQLQQSYTIICHVHHKVVFSSYLCNVNMLHVQWSFYCLNVNESLVHLLYPGSTQASMSCKQYVVTFGLLLIYNFHRVRKQKKAPPWMVYYIKVPTRIISI